MCSKVEVSWNSVCGIFMSHLFTAKQRSCVCKPLVQQLFFFSIWFRLIASLQMLLLITLEPLPQRDKHWFRKAVLLYYKGKKDAFNVFRKYKTGLFFFFVFFCQQYYQFSFSYEMLLFKQLLVKCFHLFFQGLEIQILKKNLAFRIFEYLSWS